MPLGQPFTFWRISDAIQFFVQWAWDLTFAAGEGPGTVGITGVSASSYRGCWAIEGDAFDHLGDRTVTVICLDNQPLDTSSFLEVMTNIGSSLSLRSFVEGTTDPADYIAFWEGSALPAIITALEIATGATASAPTFSSGTIAATAIVRDVGIFLVTSNSGIYPVVTYATWANVNVDLTFAQGIQGVQPYPSQPMTVVGGSTQIQSLIDAVNAISDQDETISINQNAAAFSIKSKVVGP